MENQYYTLIEKQDFFEIIENKFGELAVFIDARKGEPVNPQLEYDGKTTALLKRDGRLAVKLEGINAETGAVLAESEFVMIVELSGETVERTYGVPVETVEEFSFKGRQTRADELERIKSKQEIIEAFGAVKIWKSGEK
ncbi:MAG: hypothetical protein V8R11_05930 [Alphaproteobacteria bacterium]|jgi:hypothetical protein|nr:hypothetical protein [Acetobacter sp.]OLA66872.1 MAG: hypothetical protein BHW56_01055 [Acetobacter sp. 46_36]CDA18147.1 uncharacterized protein BN575_00719 [Acetobacter sp. CAG:267]